MSNGFNGFCGRGKLLCEFSRRNEFDVLIDKVQSRFELREEFEELLTQRSQRPADTSGKLLQRRLKILTAVGVDHAENRLGLRQIKPPGQKCSQCEFAGASQASARLTDGLQRR